MELLVRPDHVNATTAYIVKCHSDGWTATAYNEAAARLAAKQHAPTGLSWWNYERMHQERAQRRRAGTAKPTSTPLPQLVQPELVEGQTPPE
ncbi:MAG TPA: hypothetical protein VFN61_12535 [Acidimicrobiales bacterium]|nr:hypothetical protein [Acidimicrobiales bacterium]